MNTTIGSRRLTGWGLAGALAAVLAAGCSEDPAEPEVVDLGPDRSTRVGLLEVFAKAHEERDIEAYQACLDDDYQFFFWDDDIGDPDWQWVEWIGRAQDIEITENMFSAEEVIEIRVTLLNNTNISEDPEENFDEFSLIPWGAGDYYVAYWAHFAVDMHVVEGQGDDNLDHWVDGQAIIYLRTDPDDPSLWAVCRIDDLGYRDRKTDKNTWSEIKRMFRVKETP